MIALCNPSDDDLAPYMRLSEREVARIVLLLLVEELLARHLAPLRLRTIPDPLGAVDSDHALAASG